MGGTDEHFEGTVEVVDGAVGKFQHQIKNIEKILMNC